MVPALSTSYTTFAGIETPRILESTRSSDVKRHYGSTVTFYMHQLSKVESQKYCDLIYSHIPNVTTTAVRIMHYPTGSCMTDHLDGWSEIDGESNSGLIVQLNDPQSYMGGYLNIEREFIDLNVGDAVHYGYEHLHGVSKIKESERWILSVRLYEEK
jgi:predicted 2-oxoglutarate/Fe(II)-dependent dioxygenase YbiX